MRREELTSADGVRLDVVVHASDPVPIRGTVITVHGITADMDERGLFAPLAERLSAVGFTTLRFSFRGHGHSGGRQRDVTIAGEILDLAAVLEHAKQCLPGPISIVAASFGAVPTCLSLPRVGDWIDRLVLWYPVLDLRRTFIEPELPWGRANFGPAGRELLDRKGFLLVDGRFELGRTLFDEFAHVEPLDSFLTHRRPALLVHGDHDSAVSCTAARTAAGRRTSCIFHPLPGADHGFTPTHHRGDALSITVRWLRGA